MEKRNERGGGQGIPSPEIVGIRADLAGFHVELRCRACGGSFESYQTTLAGVAIGRHLCAGCQTPTEVWPEQFQAALDRLLPASGLQEMARLTEEASRIAQSWYRAQPFAGLLTYRGVNLGEPTERELQPFLVVGLQAAQGRQSGPPGSQTGRGTKSPPTAEAAPSLAADSTGAGVDPKAAGELLSRRADNPAHAALLDELPSETTPAERRFLYNFFGSAWTGRRHVLEIGPFLGGTTRSIALGMQSNPKRQPSRKLYSFDRFADYYTSGDLAALLDPLVTRGLLAPEARRRMNGSTNFKDVFTLLHRDHEYFSLISAEVGVLPDSPGEVSSLDGLFTLPPGLEFDAVFVDGCKGWYATKYFMREVSRHVQPGSHFLFQDYGWYTCFWIPVFLGVMKEHFDLVAHVDSTYTFRLLRPLDADEIEARFPDAPETFGKRFFDTLFREMLLQAGDRSDAMALLSLSLQHAASLAYLGHKDEARTTIAALSSRPEFARHRVLIQQALKSPTYTPHGPIYL